MAEILLVVLIAALTFVVYTFVGYPALLWLMVRHRSIDGTRELPDHWPMITITLAAYNEAVGIRQTLESLLALDYPAEKRQILVISDASTDGTDDIVHEFADRGVELLRMAERKGKTAGENAALPRLRGEIIVNTDASIRIHPGALKPLIAAFEDEGVGLASGRDVSVAEAGEGSNPGESGYVDFEMQLREMETRTEGIVGASGCFYAIRAELHKTRIPDGLSRDFAAALITRENGYRPVSVNEAVCYVPRTSSLSREYNRKVRTIARGIQTLFYKRRLLNPLCYGRFAWMLFSHKLCRWAVPWAFLVAGLSLIGLAFTEIWARWLLGLGVVGIVLALMSLALPSGTGARRVLAIPIYVGLSSSAAIHAWLRVARGDRNPTWEPTRREAPGVR
jgi:cellulose synthase/poly-beta-1,6-N-acetylglucosamine synthase-like glycosyltransferase